MSTVVTASRDYHCNNCRTNISADVHIRCAECADFDLCVNCFSVGVELENHRKTHCYRVVDFQSRPLFENHWSAEDELLLMEAIDLYGLCNWEGIAEHIGKVTPSEVKRHYIDIYCKGPNNLPDLSYVPPHRTQSPPPHHVEELPPPSDKAPSELPDPKSKEEEEERKLQQEVLYNPLRHDFVEEYRNDADKVLVAFSTIKDNSALLEELQMELFSAYSDIVEQRAYRKDFVMKRNLLPINRREWRNKNDDNWERALFEETRIFAQFFPHEDHSEFEALLDLFREERKLRAEFEDIIMGVQNGITTVSELKKFVEIENPLRKTVAEEHKKRLEKIRGIGQSRKSAKSLK
ncbi:hypothetical protein P9112_005360 [Eukaryota sp. TZLM1-RC]